MWTRVENKSAEHQPSVIPPLSDSALLDPHNVWAKRYKEKLFASFRALDDAEFSTRIIEAAKANDLTLLTILLIEYEETETQINSFDDALETLAAEGDEIRVNLLIDTFGADPSFAAYGYARTGQALRLTELIERQYLTDEPVNMEMVAAGYVDARNFAAAEKLVANHLVEVDFVRQLYIEDGFVVRAKALKYAAEIVHVKNRLQKIKEKCDQSDGQSIVKSTKRDAFIDVYNNLNLSADQTPSLTGSGSSIFTDTVNPGDDIGSIGSEFQRVFSAPYRK